VLLVLLVGTTALALVLTLHYHLGVPGALVTVLLGLPSLYLGWLSLQEARRPPDLSLAQIADGLADRLRSEWADEAEARGLNDPYPLPVTWTAAEAPLAGDMDALKMLAEGGAGYSASARENWARRSDDLAGGGSRKLADVLAAVPTGRLVVLGEPGTGKTMLMVGLVLDLLHPGRRRSSKPVPVLVSLASWDPVSQDLHGWLGATLITGYPDLAAPAPPGAAGGNAFEALVDAGLILPVLDGLDEIPESARPVAIARINKELKPGEQLVITCRTEQYQAAVSPQDGQGAVLRAAAVQLSTLKFDEVARYLCNDAGPTAAGRWDFLDSLSTESPVRQALATPLMAGLARAIYNPRPDERARDLRDPAELCGFADPAAVEAQLLDAFVPAAYQPTAGSRWTKDAETWLVFLARHLEYTIGSPDFAWWQLRYALPRTASGLGRGLAFMLGGLVGGLVAGLTAGLAGGLLAGLLSGLTAGLQTVLVAGLWAGFTAGPVIGLAAGLTVGPVDGGAKTPARDMRIRVRVSSLVAGLTAGLAFGLAFGLAVGLAAGLAFGLVAGLGGAPDNLARATSPRAVFARDRRSTLLLMLVVGLAFGLAYAIVFGITGKLVVPLGLGLVTGLGAGIGAGLVVGFTASWAQTAWPSYMITRGWLAFHHHLPRPLMSFLADAHQRGVLRQVGAVYQFRHIELQHRLATRDAAGQHENVSAAVLAASDGATG
jgi:hypothetical protein